MSQRFDTEQINFLGHITIISIFTTELEKNIRLQVILFTLYHYNGL